MQSLAIEEPPSMCDTSQQGVSTAEALKDFPVFRMLPIELRLLVWQTAAKEPRVILFTMVKNKDFRLLHTCIVPALLHVNKESRKETKQTVPEWVLELNATLVKPLKFFRYSVDIAQVSFKDIMTMPIDEKELYIRNFRTTVPVQSSIQPWVSRENHDGIRIFQELQRLQGVKAVAINREFYNCLPKTSSLWHLATWITYSIPMAEKFIVVLDDKNYKYFETVRSGPICQSDLKADKWVEGVVRREKNWEIVGGEEDSKEASERDSEEWEAVGGKVESKDISKQGIGRKRFTTQYTLRPKAKGKITRADGSNESWDDMSTRADRRKPVKSKGLLGKIINNVTYANHVMKELERAKEHLDDDPTNVRRTLRLDFEVCSSE